LSCKEFIFLATRGRIFLEKRINQGDYELEERVIETKRVSLVKKGGKTISFSALSVVGNREGIVGLGFGKANDTPSAIAKSFADAKKNLIKIPLVGTTTPHEITGIFGAGKVFMKPASEGTGVIAGLATKAVLELAGVRDLLTKRLGSRNTKNTAMATIEGLKRLKDAKRVAKLRGKSIDEIFGWK